MAKLKFICNTVLLAELCLLSACRSIESPTRHPNVESTASPSNEIIHTVDGHTIEGEPISFDFQRQKKHTLLFVMTPSCPFCRINFHNWRSLLASPVHIPVVWVDTSDSATENYRAVFGLDKEEKVIKISGTDNKSFPFWTTPTTALIKPDGHIEWSREGVLTSADVAWLKRRLNN